MAALYVWGKPLAKEFATQSQTNIRVMHLPEYIQNVSSGEQHSIIITKNGVYGVGSNLEGQLGYQLPLISGLGLVKLDIGNHVKIVSVSCGWHHTLLLDQNGNVYSSGKGDNGQLGRGRVRCSSTFNVVISKARQISAGKDHSLALCGSKVFGWGNSNEGQLGLLITKNYFTPHQLNVYPCQLIFAGPKYSIFITSKGIYGTGTNYECQLGLGHSNSVQVPRRIALQQKIVKIVGSSYCCACNTENEWYMWGKGAMGLFRYPTKMSFLKGARYVQLGINCGIYQKQNKLFVWGENRWGELCLAQEFNQYPTEIESLSELALKQISCGGSFMIGYVNNQKQGETITKKQEENTQLQKEDIKTTKQKVDLFKQFRSNCNSQSQNHSQIQYKEYCKSKKSDFIVEVKRKLYSQENSLHQNQQHKEKNVTHSQKLYQIINQPLDNRSRTSFEEKARIKQMTKMSQFFQKQNRGLKERLQFQRFQRLRLKEQFSKNMIKFQQVKMSQKMENFQTQMASNKTNQKHNTKMQQRLRILKSLSPKQSVEISFRPQHSEKEKMDLLGTKIDQLSKFLHEIIN